VCREYINDDDLVVVVVVLVVVMMMPTENRVSFLLRTSFYFACRCNKMFHFLLNIFRLARIYLLRNVFFVGFGEYTEIGYDE